MSGKICGLLGAGNVVGLDFSDGNMIVHLIIYSLNT